MTSIFSGTYGVKIEAPDGTKCDAHFEKAIRKRVLWYARRRYKEKGNPIIYLIERGFNYSEKMFYFALERKLD